MIRKFRSGSVIAIILLAGCGQANSLDGKWNMTRSGSMKRIDLERGDVRWTFLTGVQKIVVENSVEDRHPSILKSGSYDYVMPEPSKITIDGTTYDIQLDAHKAGVLTLTDNPESDGPIITFERDN